MHAMSSKDLKPQNCPRCSAAMTEVGRATHPRYSNLVNVQFRCEACGYETVLAVAPIDE
jgi:C4-type Zn-finger protein